MAIFDDLDLQDFGAHLGTLEYQNAMGNWQVPTDINFSWNISQLEKLLKICVPLLFNCWLFKKQQNVIYSNKCINLQWHNKHSRWSKRINNIKLPGRFWSRAWPYPDIQWEWDEKFFDWTESVEAACLQSGRDKRPEA